MHEEKRDEGQVIKHVDIAVHNRDQFGKTSSPERSLACRDHVKKTSNPKRASACDIGMVGVSIDNDEQQQQQNTHNAPTSPITPDNPVSALLDLFEVPSKHRRSQHGPRDEYAPPIVPFTLFPLSPVAPQRD